MRVSLVIPNYQGEALLPETLRTVEAALGELREQVEVLVSDDASTDRSCEVVRDGFPWVRLVRRERNAGFSGNCLVGAQAAQAPLVYFLNSDARPQPGFLPPLLAAFAGPQSESLFAAQSLTVDAAGRPTEPTQVVPRLSRGMLRLHGLLDARPALGVQDLQALLADHADAGSAALGLPTLYATGGAVLLHRQRFLELGGFSEAFAPFYYEDVDLGWRAWRRGWRSLFVPTSVVVHDSGGTIGRTSQAARTAAWRKRNRHLVLWRNLVERGELLSRHVLPVTRHHLGRLLSRDLSSWRGLRLALAARAGLSEHRRAERAAAAGRDAEWLGRLRAAQREALLRSANPRRAS
ncbi:MAG: glycosyltransferase family 2 protein [Planctomycetota bacterium]